MRPTVFIGTPLLGLSLLAAACQHSSEDRPNTPAELVRKRPLAEYERLLDKQLTPELARARFGAPDQITGSGLRIYVYDLDLGQQLWLGFPGDAPIVYARVRHTDGSTTDLVLR